MEVENGLGLESVSNWGRRRTAIDSNDRNPLPERSLFFNLPRELRDQIYRYVLASDADFIRPITGSMADQLRASCGTTRRLALETGYEAWPFPKNREYVTTTVMDNSLLLVSKQIHDEAEKVLVEQHSILLSTVGRSWEQGGCWMNCGNQAEEIQPLVERMLSISRYARHLWVRLECALRENEVTMSYEKELALVFKQQRHKIDVKIISCTRLEQGASKEQNLGTLDKDLSFCCIPVRCAVNSGSQCRTRGHPWALDLYVDIEPSSQ